MKKIKNNLLIKFIFIIFFMFFSFIYFSEITGYYEYSNNKKNTLTELQIQKFEEDIKNGNEIDITEYLNTHNYKYNNTLSILASKLSDGISKIVNKGVKFTFKYISKIVNE